MTIRYDLNDLHHPLQWYGGRLPTQRGVTAAAPCGLCGMLCAFAGTRPTAGF